MLDKLNAIALRRWNKVILPSTAPSNKSTSDSVLAAFNLNLQELGYTLAPATIKLLKSNDQKYVAPLMRDILAALKEARGANVRHRPMYPNFPEQVMEASDAELYMNAILHYFSFAVADALGDPDFVWLPKYRKDKREPLDEKIKLTVIRHIGYNALEDLTKSLMTSNTSLSATDKEDLRVLVVEGFGMPLPEVIPNRENLAVVGAVLMASRGSEIFITEFVKHLKSSTDVLRLAVAASDGDVSLAKVTKFRSFKRADRRVLLTLLDELTTPVFDMLRWRQRWLRLGERLHPGEYAEFSAANRAFRILRNNLPVKTFYSELEAVIKHGDYEEAVELLKERPGDFARRLDQVLRMIPDTSTFGSKVITAFARVAHLVSTPVLLQVREHFINRNVENMRVIFPKGNTAKVMAIDGRRAPLKNILCTGVVLACETALQDRFSELPDLGKVFIDPALVSYLVPFSQRSASKALRTLVRGSQISFPEGKDTLRFFVHWHNTEPDNGDSEDSWGTPGRVDIDLSAVMYDAEWKNMGQIWYRNLRSNEYKAYHSGDITNAPKGASEFIDIDMPSILAYGGRYIAATIHSYTGQHFKDIPETFAGWMLREKPQSGEVFEAKTVQDRVDMTADGTTAMPFIIDVVERKVIWADAVLADRVWGGNVYNQRDVIALIGKAFTKIHKTNLFDLLFMHAEARGKLVKLPKNADTVFGVEFAFELEKIASEFMKNAEKKEKAKTV